MINKPCPCTGMNQWASQANQANPDSQDTRTEPEESCLVYLQILNTSRSFSISSSFLPELFRIRESFRVG